ncbi:ClpP/crotonase-like domain-containing protein [Xylariomycetidae sp. FL0641]|nr:ClpP/crotonase-like domain-containing protein [Xylariomycetidae sp. FL0641]
MAHPQPESRLPVLAPPDLSGLQPFSWGTGEATVSEASDELRAGVDRDHAVAVIQLNRPRKRNALRQVNIDQLCQVLGMLDKDDGVRAAILMGTKGGAFCAGVDIAELKDLSTSQALQCRFLVDIKTALDSFSKPLIAAVEGLALGGGFELALACDMIYAAADAPFGLPEVSIGTIPGAGGTQRLTRALGKHMAMEVILSRQLLTGADLARRGLVNRAFGAGEDVVAGARELAQRVAGFSRPVVGLAKQAVLAAENHPLDSGVEVEKLLYYSSFDYRDFKEGTAAFVEKREAVWGHM